MRYATALLICVPLLLAAKPRLDQPLDIQLIDPHYREGVLVTDKGGVLKGKDFYLQARHIRYERREVNGTPVHFIHAEQDLFLLYKGHSYKGDQLDADLLLRKITITNGCTVVHPWFVGGRLIEIDGDGNGTIFDGYLTTAESEVPVWEITTSKAFLSPGSLAKAHNVVFRFGSLPLLWLPVMSRNLSEDTKAPFKYRLRYSRNEKLRLGIQYDLFNGKRFKSKIFFDFSAKRGCGGGFTTDLIGMFGKDRFSTFNYYARDTSIDSSHKRSRYRFQGKYTNQLPYDIRFNAGYDKLSDQYVRNDYSMDALDSTRALPTQATLTKRSEDWVTSLNARVKINDFQTVKQELPFWDFNTRPVTLGSSLIVLDSRASAGYLDYRYHRHHHNLHDFHSTRLELAQSLYRNALLGPLAITPSVGYTLISYNNSPQRHARLQAIAQAAIACNTRFVRPTDDGAIAIEPYADYEYLTTPAVPPHHHYLFDLQDGFWRLNYLRFGLRNFFIQPRAVDIDLYARAFFERPHDLRAIPLVCATGRWKATPSMSYGLDMAYDTKRHNLDHINVRGDITINADCAFSLEYRHRSSYSWRKVDPYSFIIDSYRSQHRLRHSEMSDRRDTVLADLFLYLTRDTTLHLRTRHGWHRHHQPTYHEYGFDLATLIQGALTVTLTYEIRANTNKHGKHDNRIGFGFSLGGPRPKPAHTAGKIDLSNYDW